LNKNWEGEKLTINTSCGRFVNTLSSFDGTSAEIGYDAGQAIIVGGSKD